MKNFNLYLGTFLSVTLSCQLHGLEHGTLDILQNNNTNNNQLSPEPAVTPTLSAGSTANFVVRGHNKGDYEMIFSESAGSDPLNGVMLSSVAENGRNNVSGGGVDGITYGTSHSEASAAGYYIPVFAAAGGVEPQGGEFNIDVSAAWFPFAEGWLAGHGRAAANGGPITIFNGSPGIQLGGKFVDETQGGIFTVDLRGLMSHGVEAVPSNGVMLVTGGKNEGNFALSRANADGTYTLSVMDNATANQTGYEQDGVAFCYVPVAAAGKGRVKAVGQIQSNGVAKIGSNNFTVTRLGIGEWLLQVPNASPDTGTLIISAEGGRPLPETLPNNTNNFVSYEWDATQSGWVIQSRDLPTAALQDGASEEEEMFSFVFLSKEAALALSSPARDALLEVGQTVNLVAEATAETPAGLSQVEFFVNGVSVGTATGAPFSVPYVVASPGFKKIEARGLSTGGIVTEIEIANFYAAAAVAAPMVPGYSMGIIDGGDLEADTTPPAETAAWAMTAGTPAPLAFGGFGTAPGEPALNINGSPIPFNAGIFLGTNYAGDNYADATTRGAIDNNIVPRNESGFHAIAIEDNAQGGGNPVTRKESGRLALGYFPYADGWTGAHVAADLSIVGGSANLPEGLVFGNPSVGSYTIQGLPSTGNMLAMSIGAGSDNLAGIGQDGRNWVVNVRDNVQDLENGDFSFLYIPESSTQVLSGKVASDGTLTPLNLGLEAVGATVTLGATGYEILFGDGTVINPRTAALFVSPDFNAGNGFDNIYSYHANGDKFVVFSHDLPNLGGAFQAGGFRFLAAPLAPVELTGDEVNVTVVDDLATEGTDDRTLEFRFTRTGNTAAPLTLNYQFGGTATSGSDYETLPGSVTIPAGEAAVNVTVNILDDSAFELDESVVLTLLPGAGYSLGVSTTASGTIRNAASLVPVVTVSFQEGVDGYSGQFSKFIGKTQPRTVVDGVDVLGEPVYSDILGSNVASAYLDGFPNHRGATPADDSPDVNGIVKFDGLFGNGPGQIPPGATIAKAELLLTTANGANSRSNGPFVVDRLIVPVTTATTYQDLDGGQGFEGVRGSSSGLPVSAFGIMRNLQVERGDITSIVRYWAANPEENHGFSIYTTQITDGWEYYSEGIADPTLRPKLVVSYVEAPTKTYTFSADQSARLVGEAATEDGSTLNMNFIDQITGASQEGLFRFPVNFGGDELDAIPLDEEIVRAEILLTTSGALLGGSGNAHSPGPIAVHRMLTDWDVTTNFGFYGPVEGQHIGPAASRVYGMGQGSTGFMDVTSIAQAWRAGEPNYGVNVKPETTDGWQIFWPGTPFTEAAPQLRIVTAKLGGGNPSVFDQWATMQGLPGASLNSDGDRDGIPLLMEYALGLDPKAASRLPGLVREGELTSLRFAKGADAAADPGVVYQLQTSTNLVGWTDITATGDTASEIHVSFPAAAGPRFYRLAVSYNP